jgi:Xaa-Pro aminopeptidase
MANRKRLKGRRGRAHYSGRLLRLLGSEGLEALFLTSIPNIRYLTGFTGSSAACLISPEGCRFFTDFRYRLQAREEIRGFKVVMVGARELFPRLAAEIRRLKIRRLGFEPASLSYNAYRGLRRALAGVCKLAPAPAMVERLRMVKDREEIAIISRLACASDEILSLCIDEIGAGITEREVGAILECIAIKAGAEGMGFRPIVASGPRSAMPHYRPGCGRLKKGEPLLIDFGIEGGGYNSDLTRTFQLGRLTKRYREIYGVVLEAQRVALKAIRPGITASSVDKCAREYIASQGFGNCFGHGLGHGIGIEVHEAPRLNHESRQIFEEGMVFTIEPGIYVPGWGGVRIEDMVLVEADGCRVLTSSAKGIEESML